MMQIFYLFCTLYKGLQSSTPAFIVTSNNSALWQNDLLAIRAFFFLIMTVLLLPFLCHFPLGININAISKHDRKINLRAIFFRGLPLRTCLQS